MTTRAEKLAARLLTEKLWSGVEQDDDFADWVHDITEECEEVIEGRDWFPRSRVIPLMIEFIRAERDPDYGGDPDLEEGCATICGNFIREEGLKG